MASALRASPFPQPWYEEVDTAIYLVHLAAFFLISGLFLGRSVDRDGARHYLRTRLTLLAWLYLLWTVIQGGVKVATGSLANTPVSAESLLAELWLPQSQLWFLPSLAAMTVVTVLIAPWRSTLRANIGLALAILVSLAAWGHSGRWALTMGMGLLVFFVAGSVVGDPRLIAWLRRPCAIAIGAVSAVVFLGTVWAVDPTPPSTHFWPVTASSVAAGVVASVAGTCALLVLSRLLSATAVYRALSLLGRRSLEIFLAHIIFASGARIMLTQVGITDLALHMVAGLSAGLLLPIALAVILERARFPWLFRPPRALNSPALQKPWNDSVV